MAEEEVDITWTNLPPFRTYTLGFSKEGKMEFARIVQEVYEKISTNPVITAFSQLGDQLSTIKAPIIFDEEPGCIIDPVLGGKFHYPVDCPLRLINTSNLEEELHSYEKKGVKVEVKLRGCLNRWIMGETERVSAFVRDMKERAEYVFENEPSIITNLCEEEKLQDYLEDPKLVRTKFKRKILKVIDFPIEDGPNFEDIYQIRLGFMRNKNFVEENNIGYTLIFDMADINSPNRSPAFFCPLNNYGFLIYDLDTKKFRSVESVGESCCLADLRSEIMEGDSCHFPALLGDYIMDNPLMNKTGFKKVPDRESKRVIAQRRIELRRYLNKILKDMIPKDTLISYHTIVLAIEDLILSGVPTNIPVPSVHANRDLDMYFFDVQQNAMAINVNSFNCRFSKEVFSVPKPHKSFFQIKKIGPH